LISQNYSESVSFYKEKPRTRRGGDLQRSKLFFETGVKLFEEQKYDTARSYFIELIKSDRNDSASREYLYLCNSIINGESEKVKNIEIW